MTTKFGKIATLTFAGLLASAAGPAHATPIYNAFVDNGSISTTANGFGNTTTVLTVHSSTVDPEQGCIAPDGSGGLLTGVCGGEKTLNGSGTTVIGGQEAPPTGFPKQAAPTVGSLGITDASQLAILFNNGTSQQSTIDIVDMTLKVYDVNGVLVLSLSDAFSNVDPNIGQGAAWEEYLLAGNAAAAFDAAITGHPNYYLAMDGAFSPDGSASESFELAKIAGAAPTPEPSSLLMLGTGILGVASAFRKRVPAATARS